MANTSIKVDTIGLGIAWALGETYRVFIDQGFLTQASGLLLPLAGGNITTFTTWATTPTISSSYPANSETASEENKTITLAINRANIVAVSGSVYLYKKATPNVLVATYTISSNTSLSANTAIVGNGRYNNTDTMSGNIITIPINHYLTANTSYFVRTSANIVQDLDGYKFSGITSNTAFAWTTSTTWQKDLSTAPIGITYNEDTQKAIASVTIVEDINNIIDYENSSYTLQILSNTNVAIKSLTINSSNWSNNTHTLTGNAIQINNSLSTLTLVPADDYTGSIILNYTLTTPPGNIYTRSQTITCAGTNAESGNLAVSRGYYFNSNNAIFASSPVQIDDSGVGSGDTYSVVLTTANAAIGGFGYLGNIDPQNTFTITGNKAYVNSLLPTVRYFPDLNYTANTSIYYTQIRNGNTQTITEIPLTYLGPSTPAWANVSYTITSGSQTITLDSDAILYGNIQYLLVAGGGGGSVDSSPVGGYDAGVSGLPGGILENLNFIPTQTSYTITIGTGGIAGSTGANTTGFGNTVLGGFARGRATRSGGSGYVEWYIPGSDTNVNSAWSSKFLISAFDTTAYSFPANISQGGGADPRIERGADGTVYYTGSSSGNVYWVNGITSTLTGNMIFGSVPKAPMISFADSNYSPLYPIGSETGIHRPNIPTGNYGWGGFGGWTHPNGNGAAKAGSGGFGYAKINQRSGTWTLSAITPSAPSITAVNVVALDSGNVTINISYNASADNGGASITSYTAYNVNETPTRYGTVYQAGGGTISITQLSLSKNYSFVVYATNSVGNSSLSSASVALVYTAPSAPTINSISLASNTSATISYTAPTFIGNGIITSYTAISNIGNTATVTTSSSGNITVGSLAGGRAYSFVVYATNSYGNSANSSPTTISTPSYAPGAPTINLITLWAGNTNANISYTAGAPGTSITTSYTAVSNIGNLITGGNITATVTTANSGNIIVNNISGANVYSFIVYASSAIGNSANSTASIISVAARVPSVPVITAVTLLSSNTSANISYIASTDNGGKAVTSYTGFGIQTGNATLGNSTETVTTSSSGNITVNGLGVGLTYSFTIYATNSIGISNINNGYWGNTIVIPAYTPPSATQVLMHFEGSNNSSTFTDSSTNAFTFTRLNSTTYISTDNYKFGSASFYDSVTSGLGQGIYINGSRPSALQCQGNFTVEWFAKLSSSGAVQAAFGLGQALFNLVFIRDAAIMVVEKSTTGTYATGFKEVDFTLPSGCYSGTWKHYAFVRNGNACAFYVDGTACSVASGTASTMFSDGSPSTGASNDGGTAVCIGDTWYNSDYGFRGSYMDEFRFSNAAIYTSNFSAPSSAFTS